MTTDPHSSDRTGLAEAELLGNLPLQYADGPDYCTVTDATGCAFALTVQPELMKLMEQATLRPTPANSDMAKLDRKAMVQRIASALAEGTDSGGYDTLLEMYAHLALSTVEAALRQSPSPATTSNKQKRWECANANCGHSFELFRGSYPTRCTLCRGESFRPIPEPLEGTEP